MQQKFYSNGKLLLSGEYAVLEGIPALAIPTRYGQSLTAKITTTGILEWTSIDDNNTTWFQAKLTLDKFTVITTSDGEIAKILAALFLEAKSQNPQFLSHTQGMAVTTRLNFPRLWGLGTSSTLINNIAQWATVDAYTLLWKVFGGSGYDIACAQHQYPITYQLKVGKPYVEKVAFDPPFKTALYFVYLNQKQRSRAAVADYRKRQTNQGAWLNDIAILTKNFISATSLTQFEALLEQHEAILAKVLGIPTVKAQHFPDYSGALKSLGAWGGDFILATATQDPSTYFKDRGFTTIVPYSDMVL